jgi:L-serine dehydratase
MEWAMNLFDIIGPVMVGPSSSHTAGAVRIGRIAGELLGEPPVELSIQLHGSFAKTYKGHGTDRALVAGLMGMKPDNADIECSLRLAEEAGIKVALEPVELKDAHPNTAVITAAGGSGRRVTVQGASVGGGNVVINRIDGMEVEFTGSYNTLIISHTDAPGVVASVANLLAGGNVNIASMKVYRLIMGGEAIMVIETDQEIGRELEELLEKLPKVKNAALIKAV